MASIESFRRHQRADKHRSLFLCSELSNLTAQQNPILERGCMTRKSYVMILTLILCGVLPGCFKAPRELQIAMQKQNKEIIQAKRFYNDAINKLFDAIERAQVHSVNELETVMINKYKFKKGQNPGTVASDDRLNVIFVGIETEIRSFATQRRVAIRKNIAEMKAKYLVLNQSMDNIEKINKEMATYIDSLIRYKKAQKALGETLLQKMQAIVPAPLPSVDSIGDLLTTLKSEFPKAAMGATPSNP